jgi:hypothetical protein
MPLANDLLSLALGVAAFGLLYAIARGLDRI